MILKRRESKDVSMALLRSEIDFYPQPDTYTLGAKKNLEKITKKDKKDTEDLRAEENAIDEKA